MISKHCYYPYLFLFFQAFPENFGVKVTTVIPKSLIVRAKCMPG